MMSCMYQGPYLNQLPQSTFYARVLDSYDEFKRCDLKTAIITGTKIHVAVESNGLPISIRTSSANEHDSTKFIDVMESILDFVDDDLLKEIISVYADKGYDSKIIRNYLKNRNILDCIPHRNFKTKRERTTHHTNYNKTRFVVERFFAWLKCGFHRTRIRYEKKCDNYLGFVYLASIVMYWRVLG